MRKLIFAQLKELMLLLEHTGYDEYPIDISDAEKDALHTVKDCIDLVARKLGETT